MRTQLKLMAIKQITNSVVVLGIHIDNKLTFDDYMFMQLNEIGRLKRYLGKK